MKRNPIQKLKISDILYVQAFKLNGDDKVKTREKKARKNKVQNWKRNFSKINSTTSFQKNHLFTNHFEIVLKETQGKKESILDLSIRFSTKKEKKKRTFLKNNIEEKLIFAVKSK